MGYVSSGGQGVHKMIEYVIFAEGSEKFTAIDPSEVGIMANRIRETLSRGIIVKYGSFPRKFRTL